VLKVISENPPNGGSYELAFESAAGSSRGIAALNTNRGPNIAACSPSAGRIVITTASGYKDPATEFLRVTVGDVIVIDFTSGSVLLRQTLPVGSASTQVNDVIVSHDGAFAALATSTQTTIIILANGRTVAQFSGVVPLAFSWDEKQLAVDGGPGETRGEVLSVPAGQVVWSDNSSGQVTQGAAADPASSNVMLFATTGGLSDLLVISASGTERTIATEVFPAQIAPCATCSAA